MKSGWKALLSHRKVNWNTSARRGHAHTHRHVPVQTCLALRSVLTPMSAHCLEFFLNKFNLISDTGKTNLKAI